MGSTAKSTCYSQLYNNRIIVPIDPLSIRFAGVFHQFGIAKKRKTGNREREVTQKHNNSCLWTW